MDKNLEYSVVIPYGKISGNFARCISSVVRQNIPPSQVIVVINGSVDKDYAYKIIESVDIRTDIEVICESLEGRGNANRARNHGVKLVTAKWVAFLDSDDWWDSRWMSVVFDLVRTGKFEFVYGSISYINERLTRKTHVAKNYISNITPHNYLLSGGSASTDTYVVDAKLASRITWDESLLRHQDYDYFVRVVDVAKGVGVVDGVYVNVDWTVPHGTAYARDCISVVRGWRSSVNYYFYLRYIGRLMVRSVKLKDFPSLGYAMIELVSVTFTFGRGFMK